MAMISFNLMGGMTINANPETIPEGTTELAEAYYWKGEYMKKLTRYSMWDYMARPWLRTMENGGNSRWRLLRKVYKRKV